MKLDPLTFRFLEAVKKYDGDPDDPTPPCNVVQLPCNHKDTTKWIGIWEQGNDAVAIVTSYKNGPFRVVLPPTEIN
jgi:hypothetical protein